MMILSNAQDVLIRIQKPRVLSKWYFTSKSPQKVVLNTNEYNRRLKLFTHLKRKTINKNGR